MPFVRFFILILSRIKAIALTPIDVRDLIYFVGLGVMSYGIYMFMPWLSFVVCGAILMITAYISGGK